MALWSWLNFVNFGWYMYPGAVGPDGFFKGILTYPGTIGLADFWKGRIEYPGAVEQADF